MSADSHPAYGHEAGSPMECLSLPIQVDKEPHIDPATGHQIMRIGFKIGGGIDQDPAKSPHKYPDTGIYITAVEAGSPADRAGVKQHDKILQGITHKLDEQFVKHQVSEFSMEWNPNMLNFQVLLDSSTFGFHSIVSSDT